jgi:PAS domain S-box-containing protein
LVLEIAFVMNMTKEKVDISRMFHNLLSNLPGMVYKCNLDVQYTMVYVSEGCEELTGWKSRSLLFNQDTSYEDLIVEEDRQAIWDEVTEAVNQNRHFEITYRIKTRTGTIKWVWEKGNGVLNPETGEIDILEGFITDITQQMLDKQKLAERESRLREVLESVDIGILYSDKHGKVLEVNNTFSCLTGIPGEDIIGQKATKLVRKYLKGAELAQVFPLVLSMLAGQKISPFIVHINKRILEISTKVSSDNRITGFFTDKTSDKNFEDQIVNAKIKAEESDRLKSTFLANMSHEIRTPMNGIVGFTELLRDPDLTESDKQRFIDIIHANSEQLLNIINDILDVSRIEAGRLGIFPSRFDPFVLMRNLTDTARILVEHRKIDVRLHYDLPNEATIETDKNRLQQILFNLISNAVKFTNKGYIEIGCHRITMDYIEFYVKDTGIGIKKEAGHRIFERFRQVDEGDTRPYGGTGLGLSISQSLVQLLGGNIAYFSTLGKGSHFYFSIPDTLKSLK